MTQSTLANPVSVSILGQLFSNHYLNTQLLCRDDWKTSAADTRAVEIEKLFEKVRPQLAKNRPGGKESKYLGRTSLSGTFSNRQRSSRY